ncbi:solute:sodium symporters [Klebsormidium nitens]|uniref:Solute:sodium symporters n=1 Tax=Klebsormidium nitens TaxID=105231 RepID=A0A1Y1I0F6_KLENI|nr:solute:sodium symporters [Klebsormidium nitens]|eukprot:GAQ82641.1 solute:sodium symporters [Klebsormidium nitens]
MDLSRILKVCGDDFEELGTAHCHGTQVQNSAEHAELFRSVLEGRTDQDNVEDSPFGTASVERTAESVRNRSCFASEWAASGGVSGDQDRAPWFLVGSQERAEEAGPQFLSEEPEVVAFLLESVIYRVDNEAALRSLETGIAISEDEKNALTPRDSNRERDRTPRPLSDESTDGVELAGDAVVRHVAARDADTAPSEAQSAGARETGTGLTATGKERGRVTTGKVSEPMKRDREERLEIGPAATGMARKWRSGAFRSHEKQRNSKVHAEMKSVKEVWFALLLRIWKDPRGLCRVQETNWKCLKPGPVNWT